MARMIRSSRYQFQPFPFLSLPLEVRRKVYLLMRDWASYDHLAVLRVSKQIFSESQESFFQRPLICSSETALIQAVAKASPVVLNKIQTLIVSLEGPWNNIEANIDMLIEPLEWQPSSTIDLPYIKLLRHTLKCLTRLPKIQELSILCPVDVDDEPEFKGYYEAFAEWLKSNYNHMGSLKLTIVWISLEFITSFEHLHDLCFTGYSLTPARHMCDIIQTLDRLESLTLIRPPPLFDYMSQFQAINRSIDGDVLRAIKPLKSLRLLDCIEVTKGDDESFFQRHSETFPTWLSVDTLTGMCDKHGDSLRTLIIHTSYRLSRSVTGSIISFLESSTALEILELRLVDTELESLHRFPQSLRVIKIDLISNYLPAFGEADLHSIHSALPRLQELDYTVYTKKSRKLLCHFETSEGGRKRSFKFGPALRA